MPLDRALLDQRCSLLRALHVPGTPLVLANTWDAASARAVLAAGFPVVATTSGGVSATLGYADGQDAPLTVSARPSVSAKPPEPVFVKASSVAMSRQYFDAFLFSS